MPSRRRQRQTALQILFQWDQRRQPVDEAIAAYYHSLYSEEHQTKPTREQFVDALVNGVVERIPELDELISKHAEHWRIERMPVVDRTVLRLGLYEMLHVGTPPAVVIDEAIELARRYSGEPSVQFINGVLDAARRDLAAGGRLEEPQNSQQSS